MESFDYIVQKMNQFIHAFPQTRVRYENDEAANTHFIEIVPNEVYHLDNEYLRWEGDFFKRFVTKFPNESICFISDDAIVGLDKVDFQCTGSKFILNYSVNNEKTMKIDSVKILVNKMTVNIGVITICEQPQPSVAFTPTPINNCQIYQSAA